MAFAYAVRRARMWLAILSSFLLWGCPSIDTGDWSQYHADGENQGGRLVATDFALRPVWKFDVGAFDSGQPWSSPVVGGDGTIYVGNLTGDDHRNGDIIAVNPDGTGKWRATTPFRIYSAPAVGQNGRIYAIGTSYFPDVEFSDDEFRSVLITIAPDGTVLDLSSIPDGYTAGSPTVWSSGEETYVFIFANTRRTVLNSRSNALFVFDGDGNLVTQHDLGCSLPLTGGPSIIDLLKELHRMLGGSFDTSGIPPDPDVYGWVDPTVAIADRDDLVGVGDALVVVSDQTCSNLAGFEWDPPELRRIWFVDENGTDFIPTSSPVFVTGATEVVVAREDGIVSAYDPASGDSLWTYDTGEEALGTPAALLRQIYVTSRSHVRALEPTTGDLAFETELISGTTASSPVVSASNVFVGTTGGFQSWDLLLDSSANDPDATGGSAFSPAIAEDGSVYTLVRRNARIELWAYSP